jgi:hypothetical protein
MPRQQNDFKPVLRRSIETTAVTRRSNVQIAGVLWTCSIFPVFGPKGARGTVLPARRCGNIQLSAFACADRSAALAITALGTATKFNERAEHFRPATLEVRIPL